MNHSYSIMSVIAFALVAPAVLNAQEAPKSANEAVQSTLLLLTKAVELVKTIKDADSGEKAVPVLVAINKQGRALENYLDKLPDPEKEAAFKTAVATEIAALVPQLVASVRLIRGAQYYGNQKLKRQLHELMDEADDAGDDAKEAIIGDDDDDHDDD